MSVAIPDRRLFAPEHTVKAGPHLREGTQSQVAATWREAAIPLRAATLVAVLTFSRRIQDKDSASLSRHCCLSLGQYGAGT